MTARIKRDAAAALVWRNVAAEAWQGVVFQLRVA